MQTGNPGGAHLRLIATGEAIPLRGLEGPEILVVPREKTPTGAAARGNPGGAPVLAS